MARSGTYIGISFHQDQAGADETFLSSCLLSRLSSTLTAERYTVDFKNSSTLLGLDLAVVLELMASNTYVVVVVR